MIYLDNAATSYPKPFEVINAVSEAMSIYGANPGRSGHNMSVNSAMAVFSARETLDSFFNGYGSEYVAFTANCTYALNMAIKGIIKNGDHVIISCLEHNSVARPVYALAKKGIITYSVFDVGGSDEETVANFAACINSKTRLAVITSVSNVFGNILPIKKLAKVAHDNGITVIADGAQGAGIIPIDIKNQGIDCLCIPGHKGLMGPMGTGAIIHNGCIKESIIEGGTGSASFNLSQPEEYPDMLESGTLNVPGICGMKKGAEIIGKYGVENVFDEESALSEYCFNELKNIENVILYREKYNKASFAPLVSFNVKNMHSEQVSAALNNEGVAVRAGYHCAPLAHEFYGTAKTGAVRVCPSRFTSEKDINNLLNFVRKIAIQ